MNSQSRFLRQGSAFRPRLERLERRDCPSCTVFQREETLTILGDREANHIEIADTREGDIVVTCDGGEEHRFTGVNRIEIRTLAGDDEITATFVDPSDPSFEFRADLGAGNDKLSISGFDPQPDPPLRRRTSVDIHAGAGDDTIVAKFICPSDPSFHFRADLGSGNDKLSISGFDPQPDPPLRRNISVDIHAGAGDDAIEAIFACPSDGFFHFRADLGSGNDRLSISGFDPQPDPPLASVEFDIRAGAGDDAIAATFACPSDGFFHFRADLGSGNDRLSISGFDPQPDPPLSSVEFDIRAGAGNDEVLFDLGSAEINGRFVVAAHGGLGNDRLSLGGVEPCYLPESDVRIGLFGNDGDDQIDVSFLDAEIEGLFSLAAIGGAGNDVIDSFLQPCVLPAGRAILLFDGGADDDRIAARFEMDADSQGALAAAVFGGSGDDDLTLAVLGADELSFLLALVDGGRGFDVACVTRNVRVVNCEEVIFLDEPR